MPVDAARREELLDHLVELFLAEGFRHLTLGRMAATLHCSKSTLYALGHSKEQVTVNTVVRFFQTAAAFVETQTEAEREPAARIVAYLRAVAAALRPASPAFVADLAAYPPARAVYGRNTRLAAGRVHELIADGVERGTFRPVHAAFVADAVAATMVRIQSGAVRAATGLSDADAYDELAALVVDGIRT